MWYEGAYREHHYYTISKGKARANISSGEGEDGSREYYDKYGKPVTKIKYKRLKKKLLKGKKASYFKWRKNTKKNRKKYLK